MTILISNQQLESYQELGYLLIEDLVSQEEVVALRNRLREYTHEGRSTEGLQIQIEPRVQRGELKVEHIGDGIRKVDSLVQTDDLFQKLGLHENLLNVLIPILGSDIKMFRNSLLLKPPEVGSQKGWHQDSPYWAIEPMELCSCWFPLDDATLENGCMMVIPKGHKLGALPHIAVTDDFVIDPNALEGLESVAVPMKAGSGLFFHSLIPHFTAPNRSQNWRRAIALSYMSSRSKYIGNGESPTYFPICGESFEDCVK